MTTKSSQSNPSRNSPGSLAPKTDTNPNLYNWIFGENIILVQVVFLKLFTMIYLTAFTSIYVQIPGLYGKDGMLPVNNYLNKVAAHVGANKYNVLPTLFWLSEYINKYILYLFPSLQNFQAEENLFHVICLVNIVLCFCILFDTNCKIFFKFWTFFVLWISYLSIYLVGQTFLSFQWDIFILETGFLAMFFVPNKQEGYFVIDQLSVVTRELLRWLMFRFMFSNGVVKLLSADHTWWNLSALDYHFESQPLPNPFAKWWHFLPIFIKKFGVANMFIVEIFLPVFFYCPIRTVRLFSGVYQIPFQLSIILTGNYNWFNLHTIVLCIPLFDDKFIKRYTPNLIQRCLGISNIKVYQPNPHKDLLPEKVGWILSGVCMVILFALFQVYFPFDLEGSIKTNFDMKYLKNILINSYFLLVPVYLAIAFGIFNLVRYSFKPSPKKIRPSVRTTKMTFASIFFAVVFLASIFPFFHGIDAKMDLLPAAIVGFQPLYHMVQSFSIVNSYGLFRVMTGVGGRPELIVQGSYNKQEWLDYEFWYKPGNLEEKCKFNIPHQPRLDWQMWFAALGNINQNPWLINMIGRLFSNSPSVVELIKRNPFEEKPPSYIRIMQYKYAFANEKSEKEWQILNPNGEEYLPAISRSDPTINKYLRDAGFQAIELQSKYPVHPWQGIPVVRIVLTVLVVNIVMNFVRNKRRS